jgi:hypothetical protein
VFGAISDTRPHLWYKPQILSELWGIIIDSSGVFICEHEEIEKSTS